MKYASRVLQQVRLYEPARAGWLWVKRPAWWRRQRRRMGFFASLAPRGSLCFDIGANVGGYTADLLRVGAGQVVAVEPQAACLRELRQKFGGDRRVCLVPAAVGPAEGTTTLYASDATAIASCSREWLDAVKSSGRFAGHDWNTPLEVPMTTLDKLIICHGQPAYCKIDVEGFELDVLRGLTTPIPTVSFEFSPETIHRAIDCVERLARIGDYRFNYCAHDSYDYGLPERLAGASFQDALRELPADVMKWGGDVYAWCRN